MPLLKILNESYRNGDALENLIHYVCRNGHVGGVGVDPEYALMQMSLVKCLWHKEAGRQVWHFNGFFPFTWIVITSVRFASSFEVT